MRWTTVNIKYCPCLTKQILRFIGVAHKTSFTLRGVTNIFLQTHQIVCLLREIHCFPPSGIFNVLPIRPWSDPKNPTTTNCTAQGTLRGRQEQILLKNTTLLAPAICCACHDQRHLNFTNYQCCTCRQKKPINFTKCIHTTTKKEINFSKSKTSISNFDYFLLYIRLLQTTFNTTITSSNGFCYYCYYEAPLLELHYFINYKYNH